MNLTLALEGRLLERARRLAAQRGISLNQMIRDYLAEVTAESSTDDLVGELEVLWGESPGDSKGRRIVRDDLHDRPVLRRH